MPSYRTNNTLSAEPIPMFTNILLHSKGLTKMHSEGSMQEGK